VSVPPAPQDLFDATILPALTDTDPATVSMLRDMYCTGYYQALTQLLSAPAPAPERTQL
jgi:hypothetical protein